MKELSYLVTLKRHLRPLSPMLLLNPNESRIEITDQMAARPSRLPREYLPRLNHKDLVAPLNKLVRSGNTSDSTTDDTDICFHVGLERGELRAVGVWLGMDPDWISDAGGVHGGGLVHDVAGGLDHDGEVVLSVVWWCACVEVVKR